MSRCFAFPPPGYVRNGLNGDALVDWIKGERERALIERAKAKEERRKAKKNEKKREELKSKEKLENGKKEKNHGKRQKDGTSKVKHDHRVDQKERENENDLQKSDVTEEHQPPNEMYKSSGSTCDRNKRKLQSPSSDGKLQSCGLHDHKRPRGSGSSCSVPGKEKIISLEKAKGVPMQKRSSTSGQTDIQCADNTDSTLKSSSLQSCFTEMDSQFRYLCLNWNSQPLQFNCSDVDDMEWLFEKKLHKSSGGNTFKPTLAALVNESHNLCSRACYLPEAKRKLENDLNGSLKMTFFNDYVLPCTVLH